MTVPNEMTIITNIQYLFLSILNKKMSQDSIRVVCRLRPLNKIQIANKGEQCVSFSNKDITINVQENKYSFAFDRVFGPSTNQVDIYKDVAVPVIRSVIGGFNGTIFAYGQTGGGKTWTMQGPNHHDSQFRGLIPRTIEGIFQAISESDQNVEFIIKCSYVEIYNQKLFDLLDPSKSRLDIKQDKHRGVFIQNCTEISVASSQQMLKTMDSGSMNRRVAFTGMNEHSSRSHSLFIIHVNQKHLKKDSSKQSKLYFVDLAGSEKVSKTGCQGVQLEEAKNINKSLSSLGNVINALTSDKKEHIPYRDSKLTRILQQSLGGNSKTTLIINCSMCTYNDKETLSTLRFGYRAKSIKNKPKMNEEKSAKELLILLDAANKTIAELRLQMGGKMPIHSDQIDNTEQRDDKNMIIDELKEQIGALREQDLEKQKELKQMELRMKNFLLELSQNKQAHARHMQSCTKIFKTLKGSLKTLNKYMSRVYIDLEYWLNNLIIDGTEENSEIKSNLNLTFKNIMEFTSYYEKEVKNLFADEEDKAEKEDMEMAQERNQRSRHTKKIKLIYSEPNLLPLHPIVGEELQMSCIIDKRADIQQDNTIMNSSDKVSQEESFSEIETILESLQTKQSQRMVIQEMSYNLKMMKRENQELSSKNERIVIQNKAALHKIQEGYEEKIIDLEERVEEYRNIIKEKDLQITHYIKQLEQEKSNVTYERVLAERLKKVIDSSQNLKNYYETEEKLRSLASQRQKLFNELYKLRNQLDQAEISIIEKEEHIQSLKEVMKQLSAHPVANDLPLNQKEIEKKYNKQVYGTDSPNVVVSVKGGTKNQSSSMGKPKQSTLRKKVPNLIDKRQEGEKANILPFIKGFFS